MSSETRYGLQVTNNSKTGPAFSLPRQQTCINKTEACSKVCYGRTIRYQSKGQKAKRLQNFETIELLMNNGGPALVTENLLLMIDQVRPIDWIASKISGSPSAFPWTLRIHDVGDFYSEQYAHAWLLAAQVRPDCSFWFYTRSFLQEELCRRLNELCALPNCQGWLSVDRDNYSDALLAFSRFREYGWKLALLQEEESDMPVDLIPSLLEAASAGEAINFPRHHAGRHVLPADTKHIRSCPQVLGALRLETNNSKMKPCQSCSFCLPTPVGIAQAQSAPLAPASRWT